MSVDPHKFFKERIAGSRPSLGDYQRLMELLWESYNRSIFLFAYAKLENREDARDVCQDAFVKALEWITANPGQIPAKVNFPAWLTRIARNLIIDRFRRPALTGEYPWPTYGSEENLDTCTDWSEIGVHAPTDKMIGEEQISALRDCIEALPDLRRRVVILRDLDGLSYDAIAKEINVPTSTVGVMLHRTRKGLRDCVELKLA
jgi:RNA polymerase sigma-70 factor (ECF subfamily)